MGGVFINYRNDDHPDAAGAIYSKLVDQFGKDMVFRDFDSIQAGERYPAALRAALDDADVLLAVIGPGWLTMTEPTSRTRLLDRDHDWVRMEIVTALSRAIPIVPVLLNETPPPAPEHLPADLRQLTTIQVLQFSHRRFDADLKRLVARIVELNPTLGISRLFAVAPSPRPADSTPSTLLRAEYAVVDFTGRDRELERLRTWAAAAPPSSVALVTGPAGAGKTRLAMALRDELTEQGWTAGFVSESAPASDIARVRRIGGPVLLVVDDAASRAEQLVALTTAIADRPSQHQAPIRLLLLSRTDGHWFAALKNHPEQRSAKQFQTVTSSGMVSLRAGTENPDEQFGQALVSFARALARALPDTRPPAWPDADHSILSVHAAALNSVLRPGLPHDAAPLRQLALRGDRQHFRSLARKRQRPDLQVAQLATIATAVTLCRPESAEQASAVRTMLPTLLGSEGPHADEYIDLLGTLYPGQHALNPIRPDAVADEIVAATLTADPTIATTLANVGTDEQLVNALTLLGRAQLRHPELGAVVVRLVRHEPDRIGLLAVDAVTRIEERSDFVRRLGIALMVDKTSSDGFLIISTACEQHSPDRSCMNSSKRQPRPLPIR